MMRIIAICVAGALLAGCISAEQRARNDAARAEQERIEREARNRAYMQNLTDQCAAIGYKHGSDGMRQCLLQLHTAAQAHSAQQRAVILQHLLLQNSKPVAR